MTNRAVKRQSKRQKEAERERRQRWRGRIIWPISATITLIGLVSAALTLLPRISASVSDPVDPNDPFSSTVTITNSGYIPLRSVYHALAISEITVFVGGGIKGSPGYGGVLLPAAGQDQFLAMDDRFSFPISDTIRSDRNNLATADIAILVDYTVPLFHIERHKLFPMEARRQPNGNFYWYAKTPQNDDSHRAYYKISGPIYLHTTPDVPQGGQKAN